ncbi:MAG: DNA polymerase-3 subunit delta', partial [Arenicella sp.]
MTSFTPMIHPWNQEIWQNLTLEPERSNHALLFNGDAGLGKRDLGLALAHFVLTDTHSQSESLFNGGSHPDLHVLMPESAVEENLLGAFARRYLEKHSGKPKKTISIEQVRRLSQSLDTHPHISKHRLILIFHAETMNRNAANALLKSLEEPPANTLFIIVTDELSKLAKTIRSRCSLVNF